jgi:hypothetical protein
VRLAGQTIVTTLRQYLNYSQHLSQEATKAQDSASALFKDSNVVGHTRPR